MPDGYFESFPIPRKNVDLAGMQQNIANLQSGLAQEILDRESADATKADKTTTINGKSLEADRVIYAQDIPSKNLLPNNATTQTINGVTFTVNSDGSVTVNGTATASTSLNLYEFSGSELQALEGCILTGCPSGGGQSVYNITLQGSNSPWTTYARDNGDGAVIASGNVTAKAFIFVYSGQTVSNLVFRPMIRLASIEDDSYVLFAKTNVELSKDLYAPLMRRIVVNFGDVTIGSTGYAALSASLVPSPPNGYIQAFALMENYGNANPAVAFGINRAGTFIYGSQMTISNLRIAYFFIRESVFGAS